MVKHHGGKEIAKIETSNYNKNQNRRNETMSLIGIKHPIRRSKTVCDVRPEIAPAERNGRAKKKNIFSKMFRSFSKLGRKNKQPVEKKIDDTVLSSSGHGSSGTDSVLNDSKNNEFEHSLPGTSFGDNSAHTHGSDSASTGYVSEGSSRRMTSSLNNVSVTKGPGLDLERENKLAKRAHAARFRSETDFVKQAVAASQSQIRRLNQTSDTDMDRDETDLETDEDRESDLATEETDDPSDSFYTSDCSSTSYVTDEDSNHRNVPITRSNTVLEGYRQRINPLRNHHTRVRTNQTKNNLPSISRTMSAREFGSDFAKYRSTDEPYVAPTPTAPPTAPSPALKARIMRLTLGEQIDTNSDSNDENKKANKADEKSDSSPIVTARSKSAVKEIASKFLNENSNEQEMSLSRPVDLKRTQSTNINMYKTRPTVLEKFAPKLEKEIDNKVPESDLSKPVGIRRTQSTKILDLAANLFQPTAEIKPDEQEKQNRPVINPRTHQRKLPTRSQTCKMSSPKAIQRRQSSDSFIRELLEMAKIEVNLGDDKPTGKINDFKSQISQASTKIARRKTLKSEDDLEKPISCLRATKSTTVPSTEGKSDAKPTMINVKGKVEELDPFVKEILSSDSVPKAVKTKIREECWSLFNDPRTPKGVKQCILNTMLSKTQTD